jgi:nucleoside phosphorylase
MTSLLPPKNRGGFEVAIICALPLEADAAEAFFDCFWDKDGDRYGKAQGDQNSYRTGAIGNHNVVLAYMPGIGKGYAASVAASFRSSFQGIRLALIVGICGAVPQMKDKDIFLGDIIISDEIVRYDFGRRYPAGFYRKETTADSAVNTEVQAFLHKLKSRTGRENLLDRTYHHLRDLQKRSGDYCCPGSVRDRLFQPTYRHKHRGHSECGDCQKRKLCKSAQDATCESLRCDNKKLIVRSRPSPDGLDIHFGRIASGDTVMKSGVDRDKIADQESVIAFEMEGAGVCNNLPCIVVKGVCDYADSHKDKLWQDYTAGAAAACMRSLLEQWASTSRLDESEEECKDPSEGNTSSHLDTHPEVPSSQLPPLDEGFHSTKSHEASFDDFVEGKNPLIATVLLSVEFSFKTALSWFKQHRKYLPRDVDLRSKLKTQRVIFSSNTEILTYNASGPIEGRLALPTKDCFEVTLAIRKKLQEIEDITRRLPITTKAKVQSVSAITTLKVRLSQSLSTPPVLNGVIVRMP